MFVCLRFGVLASRKVSGSTRKAAEGLKDHVCDSLGSSPFCKIMFPCGGLLDVLEIVQFHFWEDHSLFVFFFSANGPTFL